MLHVANDYFILRLIGLTLSQLRLTKLFNSNLKAWPYQPHLPMILGILKVLWKEAIGHHQRPTGAIQTKSGRSRLAPLSPNPYILWVINRTSLICFVHKAPIQKSMNYEVVPSISCSILTYVNFLPTNFIRLRFVFFFTTERVKRWRETEFGRERLESVGPSFDRWCRIWLFIIAKS